jgi:hypothetical protein
MNVNILVLTQLVVTRVHVILDINWRVIDTIVQISMNVMKTMEVVIRNVSMIKGVTTVRVRLDIPLMDMNVMTSMSVPVI